MLKVMDLKFNRMEVLMVILFYILISIALIFFFVKVPKKKDEPVKFKKFLNNTKEVFKAEGKWLYTVFLNGILVMLILFAMLFFLSENLEKVHDIKKNQQNSHRTNT